MESLEGDHLHYLVRGRVVLPGTTFTILEEQRVTLGGQKWHRLPKTEHEMTHLTVGTLCKIQLSLITSKLRGMNRLHGQIVIKEICRNNSIPHRIVTEKSHSAWSLLSKSHFELNQKIKRILN